ncbi:MAG: hypothetical protein HQL69_06710 [Magnetococcales bacterium]|nr:hypothetical protein [Magnetococcales bacterium]
MAQFNVLTPLRHNGRSYCPGAVVEMTQQQAAALLRVAAIGETTVLQNGQSSPKNNKPNVDDDLITAINKLDSGDGSLWMKDGRPRTESLAALLGRRVSADERDKSWQQWQKENSQ